ncbi:hypothetical protein D3C73_1561400 [compost metagenome]
MPLIPGQGGGLAAGLLFVVFYAGVYAVRRLRNKGSRSNEVQQPRLRLQRARAQMEAGDELGEEAGEHK